MKEETKQVIEEYKQKFGGFPSFMFMGADDDYIVKALRECLEKGEPYKAPYLNADY